MRRDLPPAQQPRGVAHVLEPVAGAGADGGLVDACPAASPTGTAPCASGGTVTIGAIAPRS